MLRIGYARLWHHVYYLWYRLNRLFARHGVFATLASLVVLIAVTAYWLPTLQATLEPHGQGNMLSFLFCGLLYRVLSRV